VDHLLRGSRNLFTHENVAYIRFRDAQRRRVRLGDDATADKVFCNGVRATLPRLQDHRRDRVARRRASGSTHGQRPEPKREKKAQTFSARSVPAGDMGEREGGVPRSEISVTP
jgi:hypothetical protein